MNVWLISTSGRRGKLRAVIEGGGHRLQSADAVMIRADLLSTVENAAQASDITLVLDAVSLVPNDVSLSIEKLREINKNTPIVLVLAEKTKSLEASAETYALSDPWSIVFDTSEEFEAELLEAIATPQSTATTDQRAKKKRFLFGKKKAAPATDEKKTKHDKKEASSEGEDAAKSKPSGGPPSLFRRFLYGLADNLRIILVSLLLTIAVTIIYYAVAKKGLTFQEITHYLSAALGKPFKTFFTK